MNNHAPETNEPTVGANPLDTYASASSRFLIEIAAWVLGPWAVYELTQSWLLAIATLAVLFALPALFNVPGDKNISGFAVPGPIRIGIEMALLAVAIAGSLVVWPTWATACICLLGAGTIITGTPRYRGLVRA